MLLSNLPAASEVPAPRMNEAVATWVSWFHNVSRLLPARCSLDRCLIIFLLSMTSSLCQSPASDAPHILPSLAGPWIRLTDRPPLERWSTPEAEPVDFTIFQAADGNWQLIACIRKTSHPGKGRLLYRWSSPRLDVPNWQPVGIFLESSESLGHREGHLQAPFCVVDDGQYYLFYNSRGAHLMTGRNGLQFEPWVGPDGSTSVFPMGRDLMILDDRLKNGRWIAYYTMVQPGSNPATKDHMVMARTAPALLGPWSQEALNIGSLSPPPQGYPFAYTESPFVLYREGWYFRFEHMNVYASRDPLQWSGPLVACLIPENPLKFLAPEIITHEGRDYIAAYGWADDNPRGVFLAPLKFSKHPQEKAAPSQTEK